MLREFLSMPDGAHRIYVDMNRVEAVMEGDKHTTIVTSTDTYNVIQNYETVKLAWEASDHSFNRKEKRK